LYRQAGCAEVEEDDGEFLGLYDPSQWDQGITYDTCGGLLSGPPAGA
jgi:hypothetical protein